jgi:hypothetical protein
MLELVPALNHKLQHPLFLCRRRSLNPLVHCHLLRLLDLDVPCPDSVQVPYCLPIRLLYPWPRTHFLILGLNSHHTHIAVPYNASSLIPCSLSPHCLSSLHHAMQSLNFFSSISTHVYQSPPQSPPRTHFLNVAVVYALRFRSHNTMIIFCDLITTRHLPFPSIISAANIPHIMLVY